MYKYRLSLKSTLYIVLLFVLFIGVVSLGIGTGFVSAIALKEKVRYKEDYNQKLKGWSQTSSAFFKRELHAPSAEKAGDMITPEDRKLVKHLDEVSPYLLDAFLAIEDRSFFEHCGISPYSLLRASLQQIVGGEVTTGGSTLTQQLVKNEILENREKTYKRKILEILNAIRIERYYTKEEIFVAYLNSVYFGKGVHRRHMYGVISAAKGIFNKNVKELELPEAAYIAGMVQRPNAYIPFGPNGKENLERGIRRMKLILGLMEQLKLISPQQCKEAKAYNIQEALAKKENNAPDLEKYPFLLHAIEREAVEILQQLEYRGDDAKNAYQSLVRTGGLRIYTTIDKKIYEKMNTTIKNMPLPQKNIQGKARKEELGAVLIENHTGKILSFYAGHNFKENEKDHAFEASNQPGSAIKPLLAYGPALNEGLITKSSIIVDEPLTKAYSNDVYRNANRRYSGPRTVQDSLKWSLNIPAVKVFRKLGFKRGFHYLNKMGLPPHPHDGEASVLGGMTRGYTVKQMTAAFSMIANHGMYLKPHLIDRITTADGEEIYAFQHPPKSVFQKKTTNELTQMLQNVVTGGTARSIGYQTKGFPIAGKTGSTNNNTDYWFIGYTPQVSLGVWCGYDYKTSATNLSKEAWLRFFKAAHASRPNKIAKGSFQISAHHKHDLAKWRDYSKRKPQKNKSFFKRHKSFFKRHKSLFKRRRVSHG